MSATSDLDRLARDLDTAPARVIAAAYGVVKKGAQNIKTGMREDSRGIRHAPNLPYTVNYNVGIKGAAIEAEIGFDKDVKVGSGPFRTPGNLAGILAFGTATSGPRFNAFRALDEETSRFLKALGDVGADELLP